MKKILIVFGTRPEAIKMAPLVMEFNKFPKQFDNQVCVTGQHREMLDQVLSLFGIVPDYDLNVMKKNQDLYEITSRILLGMRNILQKCKPDIVFVHGDTTTSTTAALAAFYEKIPVAHVESGLRTGNIYSPWPEEMNRSITGRIATFHFAPTETAKNNLLKENIPAKKILITGNTVIDALLWASDKIKSEAKLEKIIAEKILIHGYDISRLNNSKKLILITGHRRENFGDGFLQVCNAIKELSDKFTDIDFVYPMHLNPNVREPVLRILDKTKHNLFLIEPLEYMQFIYLMKKSTLILTDSGGVQEEAPGLGKPVIVMRDTTERPEAVKAGTVKLTGANKNNITSIVSELLNNNKLYKKMSSAKNPYGDGKACERIVNFCKNI